MFKVWLSALLVAFALTAAAQINQIDPTSQIQWNLSSQPGPPAATCTQNGSFTIYPYGAQWGQFYQNSINGALYQCGPSGWALVTGGGGGGCPTTGCTFTGPISGTSASFSGNTTTGTLTITGPPIWSAPNGLAFIGDSLGYLQGNWITIASPLSKQKFWSSSSTWNMSTSGMGTAYMLTTELPAILALSPAPNYVNILGGTNDLSSVAPATTLANITSMITQLRSVGISPIICTVPPSNSYPSQAYTLNFGSGAPGSPSAASIAGLAASLSVPLVDFWSLLADPITHQYSATYLGDGIHPNQLGFKAMASTYNTATAAVFAAGAVWLPTTAQDRVNLVSDPFVTAASNWKAAQFSSFTTPPVYSKVSCSAVSYGSCFQAVITTDGNASHYLQIGPGFTANAAAGDKMLAILPYSASGMTALGGWGGGTAGLLVITGYSSNGNPFIEPFPQQWQDCTNCIMAIEYTQPPLPVSGNNVGFEFYFGGSTNSGTVTLQFGQAAIIDLSDTTIPATWNTFTQPPGTGGNGISTMAYADSAPQNFIKTTAPSCWGLYSGSSGQIGCQVPTGYGNAVATNTPQINGPQIYLDTTLGAGYGFIQVGNGGVIYPTGTGLISATQFQNSNSLPATCSPPQVYTLLTTGVPYYCSATNVWTAFGTGGGGTGSLVFISPSGDTTGATDLSTIQTQITAGNDIYLSKGNFYINGSLNWSGPSNLWCAGGTQIEQVSTTANFTTVSYGGGLANTQSTGMGIRGCLLIYKSGVSPTCSGRTSSGCNGVSFSGTSSSAYGSAFHFEDNIMSNIYGGIYVGNYVVNNYFTNNLFIAGSNSSYCVHINTPVPSGDTNFDGMQCAGSSINANVEIFQSDTSNFTNLKLNSGAEIKFLRGGAVQRVIFTNLSCEDPLTACVDWGTGGSYVPFQVQFNGGGTGVGSGTFFANFVPGMAQVSNFNDYLPADCPAYSGGGCLINIAVTNAASNDPITSGCPISANFYQGYWWNNTNGACKFNLPTPMSATLGGGTTMCFANGNGTSGTISLVPPSGVKIIYGSSIGTVGSATGLVSPGTANDAICLVAQSATVYQSFGLGSGGWINN